MKIFNVLVFFHIYFFACLFFSSSGSAAVFWQSLLSQYWLMSDLGIGHCIYFTDVWYPSNRLLRKSKDYVYGIWVYKVLGIWKGYYRVKKSLVSCIKPWTEARNYKYLKYHSKLTYQISFWNVSRKVDYHAGGKWFNHGPKRTLDIRTRTWLENWI